MQSVAAGWTAEERDSVRKIVQSTQISWHKQSTLGNKAFTIGVSLIGGNDIIGANPGAIGSPSNYKYFDESAYVTRLSWERGLNMPTGGLTEALAEVSLDNTSGRFTPRYMGGNSELYTAILPGRPITINAGFNYNGVNQILPHFAGVVNKQPAVDINERLVTIQAGDYIDYFQNKYVDKDIMFTAQRTDQVMTTLASQLGMNTAQYDFDTGINIIPFGLIPVGSKFSDIFGSLAEAELGHVYQDETGVFKFRNRQWGSSSPFNTVQRIISTSQVISAQAPNADHIINVVEVNAGVRTKQPLQVVFTLSTPLELTALGDNELLISFDDPILQLITPTLADWVANVISDGSGADITSKVSLKSIDVFAQAAKLVFHNTSSLGGFLTSLTLHGRPAKVSYDLYYRAQDDSSVTVYNEQPLQINNDYISDPTWVRSLTQMILNDYSNPENLQVITIRAIPELQLFDLVSWQGRYWRIYNIRDNVDPSVGFTQELSILQRNITTYFRIGISTIGGSDKISP